MFLTLLTDWEHILNYPGLELWKFINLAIFVSAGFFILKKPLAAALDARRENIKKEIATAKEERTSAEAKLAEADSLLSRLDTDVSAIHTQAAKDAALEKERQTSAADVEINKLRIQADREIESANKQAQKELRAFLASRSVAVAKETVSSQLNPEDDFRLIKDRLGDLRRARV
jgi:F-type H+-transporting ATPase subunit b